MRSLVCTIIVAMLVTPLLAASASEPSELRWYKGNTHTHTLNSDGDSTPDEVARWYRSNGYQFLVLSDHNVLTATETLNSLHGAKEQFLLIPGEEVTDVFEKKAIHVNGLGIRGQIEPQGGMSVTETLQRNVDAIREVEGVPHINHPNFGWAVSAADLAVVHNYRLLEIFNGHPHVNNVGSVEAPGLEEMWDALLTGGKTVYGIAVDDAHHFKRPWDHDASRPGQGWIVVRASALSAEAILAAMEAGDFYASTGVTLDDYEVSETAIKITVRNWPGARFTTRFIGHGGRILAETGDNPAVYELTGDEPYVRAKIIDSNGRIAWTQPTFPSRNRAGVADAVTAGAVCAVTRQADIGFHMD